MSLGKSLLLIVMSWFTLLNMKLNCLESAEYWLIFHALEDSLRAPKRSLFYKGGLKNGSPSWTLQVEEGDRLILQCDTNMVATEQNCGTSSSFDVSRGKVCEL